MPRISLGHQAPNVVTELQVPDGLPLDNMLLTVCHTDGVWAAHQTSPSPAWVEGDDTDLVQAISDHYGCPIGRPAEG